MFQSPLGDLVNGNNPPLIRLYPATLHVSVPVRGFSQWKLWISLSDKMEILVSVPVRGFSQWKQTGRFISKEAV